MAYDESVRVMTPYDEQLADLGERFKGVSAQPNPNGLALVTVPELVLPKGWNKPQTNIWFIIPNGYPYANPDCFWTDAALRLEGERMPQNTALQELAGVGPTLWFSWHLNGAWRPNKDNLSTWMAVIANRFEQRQ
jgi:hypothetical protein